MLGVPQTKTVSGFVCTQAPMPGEAGDETATAAVVSATTAKGPAIDRLPPRSGT